MTASGAIKAARLVWVREGGGEISFPLIDPPLVIGRDEDADIRIDEPLVSRSHAAIELRDGVFVVRDLESTNRTRVNGEPVTESPLREGDELRFARARCFFRYDADEPDPSADPNTRR